MITLGEFSGLPAHRRSSATQAAFTSLALSRAAAL